MNSKNKTIDPALIGEWRNNRFRQFYSEDGYRFDGDIACPISITNGGNNLHYGSDYYRMPGTPNSGTIVGDWRSDEQEETKHFHHDGSTLVHFDNESLAYFGTYSTNGNFISNLECRSGYETSGNEIILRFFDSTTARYTYSINQNTLSLTDQDGKVTIWTKWP